MADGVFTREELKIAERIITFSRREAARKLSFLEKGIYCLTPVATDEVKRVSADYANLYYNPKAVIEGFTKNSSLIAGDIVHSVMHCMLKHPSFSLPDEKLFDACADASVEAMLYQTEFSKTCDFDMISSQCGGTSAVRIYNAAVEDEKLKRKAAALSGKYCSDDHSVWRKRITDCKSQGGCGDNRGGKNEKSAADTFMSRDKIRELEKNWDTILSEAESRLSMKYGSGSGNVFASMDPPSRFSKFSYMEYLKKFAAAEIAGEDLETIDLMLYTAGMDMYGDLCLVEPYEIMETLSPTDIIFAIDMSGSCGGDMAANFLRQIYTVFEAINIKSGVNIHVLFFDTKILGAEIIRGKNDAEKFIKNYKGQGFGGTDFNCVFEYADSFSEKSGGKKLKGLFFFSDGMGFFPSREPSYKTTFFVPAAGCDFIEQQAPLWVDLVKYDDD